MACVNMAVIAGRRNDDSVFVNMFTDSVGGGGGRSFGDGIDTCGNFIAPAYAIPNIERTESLHPLMCVYRREREETAGAGIYRGGTGIEYMFIPYGTDHPMEAVYFSTGCSHMETKGVAGGLPGSIQRNVVVRDIDIQALFAAGTIPTSLDDLTPGEIDIVEAKDVRWLDPGDGWICFCTGGGGYGDPAGPRTIASRHGCAARSLHCRRGAAALRRHRRRRFCVRRRSNPSGKARYSPEPPRNRKAGRYPIASRSRFHRR